MGLAGSVHCVAMCGTASAAAVRVCSRDRTAWGWLGFHLGRLLGYSAAGAVAAASVALLAGLGAWSPALRPLWVMAHMAGLALGLWLLWQGRQPAWMDRLGREGSPASQRAPADGWVRMAGPVKAAAVGSFWFAWPCGLLQSALLVAALANSPAGGAVVMAVFALSSAVALGAGPWLWSRWAARRVELQGRVTVAVIRLSGAALAGASAWALGHDLFERFAAWCLS